MTNSNCLSVFSKTIEFELGDMILIGLLIVHIFVVSIALSAFLVRRIGWSRKMKRPTLQPAVSIFKPLCGLDDDLASNLESFFCLEGTDYEIIFAVADKNDPAKIIVDMLYQQHPNVDARVLVCQEDPSISPKVSLLIQMLPFAKHDLFWISDSNVTVSSENLNWGRIAFLNSGVGLAHNPVVGVKPKDCLAALECGYLAENCAVIALAAKAIVNLDAVTGKSIFVRRKAIESIGGFQSVADVLSDDQWLSAKVRQAGWKIELIPQTARSVVEHREFSGLLSRHIRWAVIRFKMMPIVYPFELLSRPIVLACLLFVLGSCSWITLLSALVTRWMLQIVSSLVFERRFPRWWAWIGLPLAEFIMAGVWLVPFFTNRVSWRGSKFSVSSGARIVK